MSKLFFDSGYNQFALRNTLAIIDGQGGSPSEGFQEAFLFLNPEGFSEVSLYRDPNYEISESLREQLLLQFEVAIDLPGLTDIEKALIAMRAIEINIRISGGSDEPTKIDGHNNVLAQIITLTNADLDNLLRVTAACLDSVCLLPISEEDSDKIVGDTIVQNLSRIEKFKSIIFKKDEANPGFVCSVLNFLKEQKECGYNIVENDSVVDTLVISIGMEPDLLDAFNRQEKSKGLFGVSR